jgi:hypothetical protein
MAQFIGKISHFNQKKGVYDVTRITCGRSPIDFGTGGRSPIDFGTEEARKTVSPTKPEWLRGLRSGVKFIRETGKAGKGCNIADLGGSIGGFRRWVSAVCVFPPRMETG